MLLSFYFYHFTSDKKVHEYLYINFNLAAEKFFRSLLRPVLRQFDTFYRHIFLIIYHLITLAGPSHRSKTNFPKDYYHSTLKVNENE